MLLDRIAEEVDKRFKIWAFRGSIVDWHYLDGQVLIKDFDIVTSENFEPDYVCPVWGPRLSWKFLGRSIDVFYEQNVGLRIQPINERIERIKWLREKFPKHQDKYNKVLEQYAKRERAKGCQHRGEQIRTMTSDLCGQRGHNIPVYSCALHGECTHGQACKGQDKSVRICITCEDGPWAF